MRKQIYEYIKAHNWVTVVDVVEALNINGTEVLATIMALQEEGFLQQSPAIPLGVDGDGSCYYQATNKPYQEV